MMMLDLDPKVLYWTKRHGIRIKYFIDNKSKKYVPDFFIKKVDGYVLEGVMRMQEKRG